MPTVAARLQSILTFTGIGQSLARRSAVRAGAYCLLAGLAVAGPSYSQSGASKGSWSVKSPMPAPRNEVVAVAANDKIYVLGGSAGQDWRLTRNEEYDPATDTWRARAPLPSGATHMAATVLDGKIYAVGGFTGRDHIGSVDHVFEYDLASDTWRTLAPLSPPRGSVGAAALDGKIHVVGGRVTNASDAWHTMGVVATHEVYDPATGKWTQAAPLPTARDHLVAVAVDGKLHVIGGRYGNNDQKSDLHDVYDPETGAWTSAPPLPTPRGGVSGTLYKGLIVVTGGEDEKRTYDENEAYDVKAQRWSVLAPLPAGRHGHGVAAAGQSVYVAGGALQRGGADVIGELLAFTLP
jgi:N-acetylneuraminic acid mutarotase